MKQNLLSQPPLNKSRLPNVSQNNNKKMRNHSLKKIVFSQNNSNNESQSLNSIGLFPKISQKLRKNSIMNKNIADTSLQKNGAKWYLPNNHLKKRQKLQTQGQTNQQLTQADESFVSLTNKMMATQGDIKDTMIDFKKKIELNKLFIKKEIEKKNKENESSIKREKSFLKKKRVVSSRFLDNVPEYASSKQTIQTPVSKSKLEIPFKQQSSSKKKKNNVDKTKRQKTQIQHSPEQCSEKVLPKRRSEGLFTDLQVILDEKMRPQKQKSRQQEKKLRALLTKLYKYKQHKQYSTQSFHQHPISQQLLLLEQSTDTLNFPGNSSAKLIKQQSNYQDWNKLELQVASQEISYRKSSFQQELRKISEYTDRNDASLEKYLGVRKELLKIGFQVQIGHVGSKI